MPPPGPVSPTAHDPPEAQESEAVHCAYNVKFAVCPWVYAKEMAEPPLGATNHPLNVYPDRVGLPGEVAIWPPVVVEPLLIALPPWESYVTVRELAVHFAKRVVSADIERVPVPAVKFVPLPSEEVFHPLNV